VLHRAALHGALLVGLDGVPVHFGARCVGLAQDAAGVRVQFADGRTARGAVLIGADGLHSAVRALLHGASPPRYAGYTAWRAIVPFDGARLRPGESWGRGARFGQVPLAGEQVYWFACQNAPAGGTVLRVRRRRSYARFGTGMPRSAR